MYDVLSYLYWRGDLSFEQDPLNEIDALIFSEFSYIDFNLLAPDLLRTGELTVKEAARLWKSADKTPFMPSGYLHHEKAYEALTLAGDSKRFADLIIASDIKEISLEDESQFGVTTFFKENKPFFIAFQGTDLRSLGWKEDLQMSYLAEIPSQKKAAKFLNAHFAKHPQTVSIGGHSKGSNLAIYAAIFLDNHSHERIDTIYSFDGPGFLKPILEEENYGKIIDKIEAFIPQDSFVGLLMYKLEKQQVIYSDAADSEQHDVFTWEIKGNRFIPSELTENAKKTRKIMNDIFSELSVEERRDFSETLFTVIGDGEDDYIRGDRQYNLGQIPRVIKEYASLSAEEKEILVKVLRMFYRKRLENL